ncbi:SDR family NAD(P)-dependent oxidoreductase [Pseudohongiella sp.]|uniref:Short-chain dehydrogenase/reductase SDR n=1 Tax=marine sediment metagenome TaxID=412755 RepID=A0A0F9W450_9ZZZZ|nr:SDR family NAD(P)-dependent oxidoreductase [Pseudohongiella sp.]HDZ10219.1 SDR family NAD(P)-dependent oxidoreductase [Pseudohongiella sp.]HEA62235.1 SDR family NAD(P)-dependent oxidoreductase [Pseudohongiella sp.]
MTQNKRIVIVGATSAIAEHCARQWARDEGQQEFFLLGRDQDKLDAIAADLTVRNPALSCKTLCPDFTSTDDIQATVSKIVANGAPDIVLIAHGTLPDQQDCQQHLDMTAAAITINGLSPVLFAEAFAGPMQAANAGTLALIGSVAGDRGRKSNYVYGAAKGLVTRYAQGLQHRLADTNVRVVLIKPGPTDTPMTAHLKQDGAKLASAEDVATTIVRGVDKGRAVIYAPAKWWLIMMIIRHLPRFIFNKMDI